MTIQIGSEKIAHAGNIACIAPKSQVLPADPGSSILCPEMHAIKQLGQLNQSFLLANCLWSAVASGYMIYGWRQRSLIPFLGGFLMMGVSWFTPALTMSAASIAIMFAVWWLLKQGY